jgi:hypothetical protein
MLEISRCTGRIVLLALLLPSGVAGGAEQSDQAARLWESLSPRLEQALTLEERHDTLPERAWFGPDKSSNRVGINELLDQAVALLGSADSQRYRERIRELETAIREGHDRIARFRQQRVSAPDQALWRETRTDLERAIGETEAEIARQRAEIDRLKEQFAEALRGNGLELNAEQVDFLLSTVIGDELIDLGIGFDNVKLMIHQLEDLLVASGESLDAARRYYGMYALLLEVLALMHEQVLEAVTRYQERIDAIDQRTRALLAESRQLARGSERHQALLAANIEAQQLTLQSARLYRDYLRDQAADVGRSREQLLHDLAVARNTYETVRVSGELVQMMRAGQQLLDTLFARQAPTLFTFRNLELKREFERLTLRLRQEVDES